MMKFENLKKNGNGILQMQLKNATMVNKQTAKIERKNMIETFAKVVPIADPIGANCSDSKPICYTKLSLFDFKLLLYIGWKQFPY